MLNIFGVIKTNNIIEQEKSDVRIITMRISLLDCCDNNLKALNQKIYDKVYGKAKDLVFTDGVIARDFDVPTVNKGISVTPIVLVGGCTCKSPEDFVSIARTLDKMAKDVGVNFIGGCSALVSKGMTPAEENLIRSIPQALASMGRVCSSVNVGPTKTGLSMDVVRLMGEIIKRTAMATKGDGSLGCAKLMIFCNAPGDNPFIAGVFHGATETDAIINVGVSRPGVVKTAIEKARGENFKMLCETIKRTAFKITRVGQLVTRKASKRSGAPLGIIDLSLASTPAVRDSMAEVLGEIGLEYVDAPGTTAALAMLNDQAEKGGVIASSHVGRLSGMFIPASENQGMIDAMTMDVLILERLETTTCVYSVGLDMTTVLRDITVATPAGIIVDETAIGMINQKTTAVWLVPVIGKGVGETMELGGLLGYTPVMPVNQYSCEKPVNRGGGIPAPIHSLKNQDGSRMEIYLIQHGRQCDRLCNANVDLCEEECRQAELVDRRLEHAEIEELYSSDLLRVVQTAETTNHYWSVEHVIRPEPWETSLGDMEGLSGNVITRRFAEFKLHQSQMLEDPPCPGGECADDAIQRVIPILLETAQSGLNRVTVVTHNGVIRNATAGILEMNLTKARLIGNSLENYSITELEYSPEKPFFVPERLNDYIHLGQELKLLQCHWAGQEN